ncbi:SDR family NAD(P)-dependent oxidoreductase [Actinomycetospora cinnamomea]|uniref:NAD(P)-dependent dehydrogenase (Short-subunit alcohol dehydrogenase family) n=1 Tax=Actinomycetospora cinnamomea TaxID=663609 RepID=A0A2U1F0U8_9PSEU|nr:SDR family NAD(P)-dependent oxidoreductase [Actinomycetospora cinnamomea]PVZ05782.1 NAD(P)-dependent dehydrogenase (short-subunit alcohol dehydrogenase family) [Actinomycetospora cinnamomea]
MQRYRDKVALVTGGASGIGAAIGARLVAEGAHVVLLDVDADGLGRQQAAETIVADVTDSAQVRDAVERTVERFGRLDNAFNVAGSARFGTVVDGDEEDWAWTVDLVLRGVYLSTRHEARVMQPGASIVNISSLNAHVPLYGASSYAAAKAGVEMFTKNAALELGDRGIRVNAILPGLIRTPLTAGFMDGGPIEKDFLQRIVAARAGEPDEIAGPALFLAGDEASYVNGTSLVVDGGWEITNYPDLRPVVHPAGP